MKREASGEVGFSLLELLAAMGIIVILAALLLPVMRTAQDRAKQAQTRVLFSQLSTASMNYRSDYGHYPLFGEPSGVEDTAIRFSRAGGNLYRTLTAFDPETGESILNGPHEELNPRGRPYFSFSEKTMEGAHVVDAFGNRDIIMIVDSDGNGQISHEFMNSLPPAKHRDGKARDSFAPSLTRNLRQPVVLYSAGAGAGRGVTSWSVRDNE